MAATSSASVGLLLTLARERARAGEIRAAWDHCAQAADLARRADDAGGLADVAVVLRSSGDPIVNARVHQLCGEALRALGDTDPVRTARVRAQLVATANPFLLDVEPVWPLGAEPEVDDPEARFLWLQARHAENIGVDGLVERVRVADAAIELGRRTGVVEYVGWGRRWRLDAYLSRGQRLELDDELVALHAIVDRVGRPEWRSLLALARAVRSTLQGDFAAALGSVAEALAGEPTGEAVFSALILRADIARFTGTDLEAVTAEVEAVVDGLPFLARGWSAQLALATGRREDAELWWRSLAPHLHRMPRRAPEWLVAQVGHAELCCQLGDVDVARILYPLLLPYRELHVAVFAHTPYGGPVELPLGRLAALLGDPAAALDHLVAAERRCTEVGAWPHLAFTRAALADVHQLGSAAGRTQAESALGLARRYGLRPLAADLTSRLTSGNPGRPALTRREREIVALVADGHSNAEIAARLTLSVRTVENHVSHVLDKLGVGSRSAVAAWFVRTAGESSP